jgi:hypothetical protein
MNLPTHKCGLYLTHNEHRDCYEPLADFIDTREGLADDFESPLEFRRSLETDELWVLQWYPETPVGFNRVAAATLEDVLRLAAAVDQP